MSGRAVTPFHCPYCGETTLWPLEDGLGVPVVPARVLREVPRPHPSRHQQRRCPMSLCHPGRPRLQGHPHRRAHARGAARAGLARRAPSSSWRRPRTSSSGPSRPSASASASPPRWATRCWPTWPRPSRPASTSSSSTPATTSPRPSAPATPSRPRCRSTCCTITPAQTVAEQDAAVRQGPLQDRPRPVLRAAQGPAAGRRARRVRRLGHRPASRRDPQPGDRPGRRLGRQEGQGQGLPLARWTDEQVEQYIADNGVLVNPLVHDGYPSIGCWPCTRRVAPGDDPRSGRWAGTTKTECGIHA